MDANTGVGATLLVVCVASPRDAHRAAAPPANFRYLGSLVLQARGLDVAPHGFEAEAGDADGGSQTSQGTHEDDNSGSLAVESSAGAGAGAGAGASAGAGAGAGAGGHMVTDTSEHGGDDEGGESDEGMDVEENQARHSHSQGTSDPAARAASAHDSFNRRFASTDGANSHTPGNPESDYSMSHSSQQDERAPSADANHSGWVGDMEVASPQSGPSSGAWEEEVTMLDDGASDDVSLHHSDSKRAPDRPRENRPKENPAAAPPSSHTDEPGGPDAIHVQNDGQTGHQQHDTSPTGPSSAAYTGPVAVTTQGNGPTAPAGASGAAATHDERRTRLHDAREEWHSFSSGPMTPTDHDKAFQDLDRSTSSAVRTSTRRQPSAPPGARAAPASPLAAAVSPRAAAAASSLSSSNPAPSPAPSPHSAPAAAPPIVRHGTSRSAHDLMQELGLDSSDGDDEGAGSGHDVAVAATSSSGEDSTPSCVR